MDCGRRNQRNQNYQHVESNLLFTEREFRAYPIWGSIGLTLSHIIYIYNSLYFHTIHSKF